jgi:hypothetical protein
MKKVGTFEVEATLALLNVGSETMSSNRYLKNMKLLRKMQENKMAAA